MSQVGANDGDTAHSAARNHASSGRGLREKVQHSTHATKFGGGLAAMEMAIGPENDSPSNAKRPPVGSCARTIASSSR